MTDRLQEYCRQLKLGNLESLVDQVEFNDRRQYVTGLLELAVEQRKANRSQNLIKRAGFPSLKTMEDYQFDPITFPEGMSPETLLSLQFLEGNDNILMLGSVGTGKSHLATALGMKACMAGKVVKFYRTANLTSELMEKFDRGQINRFTRSLAKADLLILDEVGYVPTSKRGSELLFSVISNCYEKQSIIVTSNLELGRWNEVFGDDRLTAALIDRLIHHAHILAFSGESYRFKQALNRKQAN